MWTPAKRRQSARLLIRFARPHRRLFVLGCLVTVGTVLFRLALPWPLRGVVEVAFPGKGRGNLLADHLPGGDPVVWLGILYLILAAGCAVCEGTQRVLFSRFAAQSVHDLRRAAVRGALREGRRDRLAAGELLARIIGDSARVKAGLAGMLVHGAQNGLLYLGICVVLLFISAKLGLLFAGAGLLAILISWLASHPVAEVTRKHRKNEGHYAAFLQAGLEGNDLRLRESDEASARKDVQATKLIALSSMSVHTVLAVTVGLAMWEGTREVRSGAISPGEFFLFVAYALTVHKRLVQVGRQTARSGKVLACAHRIGALLRSGPPLSASPGAPVPLREGLRLERVKLGTARNGNGRRRLLRTSLTLAPASKVAVLGAAGSGKSSLLCLLAGRGPRHQGRILWDGEEVSADGLALSDRVGFLPQDPAFPRLPVREVLGLKPARPLSSEEEETLERISAADILRRLPRGLEEKVSSSQLSPGEARSLSLARILLRDDSPVWVLDGALEGLGRKKARRRLTEVLRAAGNRTVVLSSTQPLGPESFDRILVLRRGRIRFDGTPAEWRGWKRARKAEEGAAPCRG